MRTTVLQYIRFGFNQEENEVIDTKIINFQNLNTDLLLANKNVKTYLSFWKTIRESFKNHIKIVLVIFGDILRGMFKFYLDLKTLFVLKAICYMIVIGI